MRYIALLRGINVGGKNKLPMAELKQAFEKAGFTQVLSYINSGNILFSSQVEDSRALAARCEAVIRKGFGLEIPVAVVPAQGLADALAHAPAWWGTDAAAKHNAIFVWPSATAEEIIGAVGEAKPEYEKVAHYGNIIFWSAPIKTFSRTQWAKVAGTSAYGSITIRNANTARRLAQLALT